MSEITNKRILIVDDDVQLRRLMRIILESGGHDIIEAESGKKAVEAASTENPDVIILDLSLPDMEGIDLISNVKEWSKVPIIVLSSQSDENEKLQALERKADDYLTKPFTAIELLDKLEACLKNSKEHEGPVKVGNLKIDFSKEQVSMDGSLIQLSQKQYALLKVLASNIGKVVTSKQLMRAVAVESSQDNFHHLTFYVDELRKKIEPHPNSPSYIVLEPKIGYRLLSNPN